jgi:hypothetical protein
MARAFDPRYLFLVSRLQQRGIAFNLEESLTESYNPLRAALTGYFTVGELGALTYVVRARTGDGHVEGFAQIRERRTCPEADVLFMAPALGKDANAEVWQHLLPYICRRAAERGIERLFARPPEGGGEVHLFSQVGFSVYTREDVFRLVGNSRMQSRLSSGVSIRPYLSEDVVAVYQLYTAVTSRLVQMAENVPGQGRLCPQDIWPLTGDRQGYVLEREGEAVGCLTVRPGRVGHWLYVLLHPKAYGYAGDLLAHGLAALADAPSRPVHCGVREYQGGLRAVLEDMGFQPYVSRALMVKHNTVRVIDPVRALRPALDKRAEVTTPTVSQVNGHQATGSPKPIK